MNKANLINVQPLSLDMLFKWTYVGMLTTMQKTLREANLTVRVHDKLLVCGLEAASEGMLNN